VTVQQGALNFSNGGTVEGTFNAAAGTTISFSGGSFSYSTAPTLNGRVHPVYGGSLTLLNDLIPNLQLVGGTLSLGPTFRGHDHEFDLWRDFERQLHGERNLQLRRRGGGKLASAHRATLNWSGAPLAVWGWRAGDAKLEWRHATGALSIVQGAMVNWSGGTAAVL